MRAAKGEARAYLEAHLDDDTDDCVIWPFARAHGYGVIGVPGLGRPLGVHVLACIHHHGPRPSGLYAIHGPCHNPACFNGRRHLCWGTPAQNTADQLRDRTAVVGERNGSAKLTWAVVGEIRAWVAAGGTRAGAAKRFGTSRPQVSIIVNDHTWRADPTQPHRPRRPRLTQRQVDEIRARRDAGEPQVVLAREYGTSTANVSLIVNRLRHVTQ